MKDFYGRTIDYMRISITDRCNLRCKYCMPHGIEKKPMEEILTFDEILTVVKAAAQLGITAIKVTGGEPLVRFNCCELIRAMKMIDGIKKVTITTNGVLLDKYLDELADAGIDGINISLDTLDAGEYAAITGRDELQNVLSAMKRAVKLQIPVKINAVSLSEQHIKKQLALLEIAQDYPIDVRFIEMMPIGYGKQIASISHDKLFRILQDNFPDMQPDSSVHGFGPAIYYKLPDYQGSIGLISALHGKFCDSCNRIRLTSTGFLKPCLCYDKGVDVRAILRGADGQVMETELKAAMEQAIFEKPMEHCFEQPEEMTEQHDMVQIGG